jgi:hypothetical protein
VLGASAPEGGADDEQLVTLVDAATSGVTGGR